MEADSQFGREINALETRLLSKLRIPSVTTTYNPGDALQRDEELDGREARTLVSKVYVPEYGRELIVKIERRREDFDKICHEAFIGLYGTNALNRLTPNFAMIYNYQLGFHCPSELPSGVDLCSKVYYEYIDGVPFEKFIRTCTLADYKAILIELFLALAYANETIGYLHMDLHGWNVIIRTLDTAEAIYFDQDPVAVTRYSSSHHRLCSIGNSPSVDWAGLFAKGYDNPQVYTRSMDSRYTLYSGDNLSVRL